MYQVRHKIFEKSLYIICISLFLPILNLLFINNTFAADVDYSLTIKPSMSLTIPTSSVALTLNPSTTPFASEEIDITIGTNNYYGYWLTMSSSSGNTELVNTNDNTKTIPTLTNAGDYDENTFETNTWGYKINSGQYLPFVSGDTISKSNTRVNGETIKLTLASKIGYNQVPGTYNTNLVFKALPYVTTNYMQNLDPDICVEDGPTIVTDSRDNQTYTIQRLKDGKCWMTQNLKLGKTTESLILTTEDSNVSTGGFTLNNKLSDGKFPYTAGYVYDGSIYYCTDAYGCYYNWWTATAGSGTSSTTSGDTDYSICPAGWVLPKQVEFTALTKAYGGTDATAVKNLTVDNPEFAVENINGMEAPGLLFGGVYYWVGGNYVGSGANYWSRTARGAYGGNLYLDISSVNPGNYSGKCLGFAVRCLLSES